MVIGDVGLFGSLKATVNATVTKKLPALTNGMVVSLSVPIWDPDWAYQDGRFPNSELPLLPRA